MKKALLPLFSLTIILMGLSILLSSSSQGRAFAANSGNTGAPGETQVCGNCHRGGSFGNTSYQIELLDSNNNVVNAYIPGTVYTLRGSFTTPVGSPTPPEYGFQVVTLIDNSTNYNAWSSPSTNTRIASAANGRSYAEHNGPSTSSVYTVSWTAPASGSGTVNFYSASNAVNNNNGTSGDNGYADQFAISENISTSIAENLDLDAFKFYPNPVENILYLEGKSAESISLRIFDQKGSEVALRTLSGNQRQTMDLSALSSGIYFLRLEDASGNSSSRKLIKR